ncbi:MAG: cell division protein FtsQ/DivIB [Paracoccaceae bacterium]
MRTPRRPGPSRLAFRLRRTWAIPAVRSGVLVYAPIALLGLLGWRAVADDGLRRAAEAKVAAAWEALVARPEFALEGVAIEGAGPWLTAAIHRELALPRGQSSLAVDVEDLRTRVEAMGGVADALVRLDPRGVLRVTVVERPPVALWRDGDGALWRVSIDGTVVGPAARRAQHPELPVLIGAGATGAVGEALALMALAPDLIARTRAFVRVGERRWDLALEGERRIMLPERDPGAALGTAARLHRRFELFDRDLAALDLRLPGRPTVRLSGTSAAEVAEALADIRPGLATP